MVNDSNISTASTQIVEVKQKASESEGRRMNAGCNATSSFGRRGSILIQYQPHYTLNKLKKAVAAFLFYSLWLKV